MIISDLEEQCVFVTDIYQELPRNKADWKKSHASLNRMDAKSDE